MAKMNYPFKIKIKDIYLFNSFDYKFKKKKPKII
jgi:hypothetical protein